MLGFLLDEPLSFQMGCHPAMYARITCVKQNFSCAVGWPRWKVRVMSWGVHMKQYITGTLWI